MDDTRADGFEHQDMDLADLSGRIESLQDRVKKLVEMAGGIQKYLLETAQPWNDEGIDQDDGDPSLAFLDEQANANSPADGWDEDLTSEQTAGDPLIGDPLFASQGSKAAAEYETDWDITAESYREVPVQFAPPIHEQVPEAQEEAAQEGPVAEELPVEQAEDLLDAWPDEALAAFSPELGPEGEPVGESAVDKGLTPEGAVAESTVNEGAEGTEAGAVSGEEAAGTDGKAADTRAAAGESERAESLAPEVTSTPEPGLEAENATTQSHVEEGRAEASGAGQSEAAAADVQEAAASEVEPEAEEAEVEPQTQVEPEAEVGSAEALALEKAEGEELNQAAAAESEAVGDQDAETAPVEAEREEGELEPDQVREPQAQAAQTAAKEAAGKARAESSGTLNWSRFPKPMRRRR